MTMKRHTRPLILFLLLVLTGISARAQWTTQLFENSSNYHVQHIDYYGNTGFAGGYRSPHVNNNYGSGVACLFRTLDGGVTWDSIVLPDTVGSYIILGGILNVEVTGPDTVYLNIGARDLSSSFGSSVLLKSADAGNTWSLWYAYTSNPYNEFDDLYFSSPMEAFAISRNGTQYEKFHHTTDGGQSWTVTPIVEPPSTTGGRKLVMTTNTNGCTASGNHIMHTTDGGSTWNVAYNETGNLSWRDLSFISPNVGFALADSSWPGVKIMKTIDGGQTWTPLSSVPGILYGKIFFLNSLIGYVGGSPSANGPAFYKTVDGGLTWTPETYPASALSHIVDIIDDNNKVYVADDSVTTNAGFKIYINTFSNSCSVSAGNDTTFCQQQGQLHATPGTPGNYLYSWSPSTGLDDPNSQDPAVTQGVSNQQYVVTMFDTANNCMATDTVLVSAYYVYLDTSYRCNNGVTLDLGPGGSFYTWMSYTDPSGNNSPINQQTQTYVANAAGTYYAGGTFPTCGSLTSMFTVIDSCFTFTCSVNAGNDTTFCQQQGQLHATPASPGNYTFSWAPSYGLDNPNIQNPSVVTGVVNQTYTVTMMDAANNCVAIDSVTVSAYYFHNDTTYTCNGQPVTLDFGPGATNYMWQFYTDTAGNTTVLNIQSQTLQVTQPGTYIGIALYPTCGALTSMFTVIDSCNVAAGNVWPGDCNYDLTANMADALHIGLGYGATGATRPNATPLWYAQPMNDWPQNFINCNYKHADADGNGIIDVNDTLPIALNYSNTHPFRLGAPEQHIASAPDLYLVANYDTVGLQTLVTVDIRLGRTTLPVDSLYGISFRITADAPLIDTTMTDVNLGSTWLGTPGTNMFHFRKEFPSMGVIDIAECGNNHVNRLNGNGSIGSFLIVTTDNLSGIAVCHFHLSDITAVTTSQDYLLLNAVDDSVVINSSVPAGISWPKTDAKKFSCYPNPASNFVTVQTNAVAEQIEICDMTGRVLLTQTPGSKSTTIDTSALSEGIYLVRVRSGNSVATQKLTITH